MPTIFLLLGNISVTINPKDRHRFPHVHIYKGHPKRPDASALIAIGSWEILEASGFSEAALNGIIEGLKARHEKLMLKWRELNDD
jgi:hypothetical protein